MKRLLLLTICCALIFSGACVYLPAIKLVGDEIKKTSPSVTPPVGTTPAESEQPANTKDPGEPPSGEPQNSEPPDVNPQDVNPPSNATPDDGQPAEPPPQGEQAGDGIIKGSPLTEADFIIQGTLRIDLLRDGTDQIEALVGKKFTYSNKINDNGIFPGTLKTSMGNFITGYELGYITDVELGTGVKTARGVKKGESVDKMLDVYPQEVFKEDAGKYEYYTYQAPYPESEESVNLAQFRPIYIYGIVFVVNKSTRNITNIHIMDTVQ